MKVLPKNNNGFHLISILKMNLRKMPCSFARDAGTFLEEIHSLEVKE
jgi:hypothetical protein